ncbi:MAG: hypothetical protein JWM95_1568 [Gemmatimonadetes bacterium]|nr:hypothetical protein [Gemmatimonadota bacterium]
MFYHNTKYKFALPDGSPSGIAGGIIACSAMPSGQLIRRIRKDIRKYPYLQHRLYDPQLYLAGLDPNSARGTVAKLASHQWFAHHEVPEYDSEQHGSIKQWKDMHEDALIATWRRTPVTDQTGRVAAARHAIQHQINLGCDAIILPAPLTNIASQNYQVELAWIDVGIALCREMRVSVPIYATVALSDTVLRGVDPSNNPLLHTITSQIAAREELDGAYVVVEQAGEEGYACLCRETLLSLLVLTDDLSRGASKQVVVNYMGTVGAVLVAAGATIWSSGYYLSQRRLKLVDFEDRMGLAMPRYFSLLLAGDIGLESDIGQAYAAGLGPKILSGTLSGAPLEAALAAKTFPETAPEWFYRSNNITSATAHYNEAAYKIGTILHALDSTRRVEFVERWLRTAAQLAGHVRDSGVVNSSATNLQHQAIWLGAYQEWRTIAGL